MQDFGVRPAETGHTTGGPHLERLIANTTVILLLLLQKCPVPYLMILYQLVGQSVSHYLPFSMLAALIEYTLQYLLALIGFSLK